MNLIGFNQISMIGLPCHSNLNLDGDEKKHILYSFFHEFRNYASVLNYELSLTEHVKLHMHLSLF